MDIMYFGGGRFGIEFLNALADSGHNLKFIVTGSAHPAGRGRKPTPTPVACWAGEHSIPLLETDNVNSPEAVEKIKSYQPQLILVIAFGQKIGNELIQLLARGMINIHGSLLPKYRGAAPVNWAIINGEKQTGITILTVSEKIDAGEILAQAETDIAENETAGELHDRLARMAPDLLLSTLKRIADGTAVYTKQDSSRATLAPKLKKSDGLIDFAESAEVLKSKVLGLCPWPGATAIYTSKKTAKSQRVTITHADIVETTNPASLSAGTLDNNLNVVCGCNALRITQIKPQGSRLMTFEDFVNGRRICPGDLFATPPVIPTTAQ